MFPMHINWSRTQRNGSKTVTNVNEQSAINCNVNNRRAVQCASHVDRVQAASHFKIPVYYFCN